MLFSLLSFALPSQHWWERAVPGNDGIITQKQMHRLTLAQR
jgi:hypothetical protein